MAVSERAGLIIRSMDQLESDQLKRICCTFLMALSDIGQVNGQFLTAYTKEAGVTSQDLTALLDTLKLLHGAR